MPMSALSVLDLSPIVEGSNPGEALANSLDLARHAERLGYRRFWVAEHHNMQGVASAATAVVIGYIAGGTSTIRVGAGGVMLPNHAPLMVAEQFGTLASLYPDRIDLGLGRAPGTDPQTSHALRRNMTADVDAFPRDVVELMRYLQPAAANQPVRAVPGEGTQVPVWILGSSLFGAQLAALLGLPFAFASHFAPAELDRALALYRERFRPIGVLERPYVMAALNVCAAQSHDEAVYLFSSIQQAFVNLRTGRAGPLPPPVRDMESRLDPMAKAMLAQALECAIIGSPEAVRRGLEAFRARTRADELIVTTSMFDHAARLRSFEIVMEAGKALVLQSSSG
jgi:luciferase family oxidoreductase group 1